MDKRVESRRKWRQLKLRTSVFLRKNGLYVALGVCLAVIGTTAAVIFIDGDEADPVRKSYDQSLNEAINATPLPSAYAVPTPAVSKKPLPDFGTAAPSVMPDLTVSPQTTPAPTLEPIVLTAPVEGEIIRVFAVDSLIYSKTLNQWMTHSGVDIAAPKGAEVRCVAAGVVERIENDDMLGVMVIISHSNGMKTVYANLQAEPPVAVGQKVAARDVIGLVGDTAISECAEQSHLHFELYVGDVAIDPTEYVTFSHTN